MKTTPTALIFSGGLLFSALMLALAVSSEDPLEARYYECIQKACRAYGAIQDEAEALEAFSFLRLANEKLRRCRSLKAQLCRISIGPAAGLKTDPAHCRRAYEQLRREIRELLDAFEEEHLFPKTTEKLLL